MRILGQVPDTVSVAEKVLMPQLSEAVPPAAIKSARVLRSGYAERSAAHWTVTPAGQVITGGVVSPNWSVWVQLAVLPHESVTEYVRVSILGQVPDLVSVAENVLMPQLSAADPPAVMNCWRVAGKGEAAISAAHCTVTPAGQDMVGGVVSPDWSVWVQLAVLPHESMTV